MSVNDAPAGSSHQIYVSFNALENTGLAVYNPGDVDVIFDLVLLDNNGQSQANLLAILLPAGEHFSIFLDNVQLYQDFFQANPVFRGTLNINVRDGRQIAVLALIQRLDTGALISVASSPNALP